MDDLEQVFLRASGSTRSIGGRLSVSSLLPEMDHQRVALAQRNVRPNYAKQSWKFVWLLKHGSNNGLITYKH